MRFPVQRCFWRVFAARQTKTAAQYPTFSLANNVSGNSSTRQESTEKCEQIPDGPVQYSGKMKRVLAANDDTIPDVIGGTKWEHLSINARKKLLKLFKMKEARRKKQAACRKSETEGKPKRHPAPGNQSSKYDTKLLQKQKLSEAMCSGTRLAVDCSLETTLSPKEICKLSSQIGRLYGSNKKAAKPFHLYMVGLDPLGRLVQECRRQLDGFDDFSIDISQKPAWDIAEKEHLVFLTPDSKNVLNEFDPSKMYVLGGLVDETIVKNTTAKFCAANGLFTARLPISEYMDQQPGNLSHAVLTVNQVTDILLHVHCTGDWPTALQQNVPARKGFKLRAAS